MNYQKYNNNSFFTSELFCDEEFSLCFKCTDENSARKNEKKKLKILKDINFKLVFMKKKTSIKTELRRYRLRI